MSDLGHLPAHHERPRWQWRLLLALTAVALISGTVAELRDPTALKMTTSTTSQGLRSNWHLCWTQI